MLQLLNDSLSSELVCVLRYRLHQVMSASVGGVAGLTVAGEILQHANEAPGASCSSGGVTDFSPASLPSRSHTLYVESDTLQGMVTEDLLAERVAIEAYLQITRELTDNDPTTRRVLEQILAQEESRADELGDLLDGLPPEKV